MAPGSHLSAKGIGAKFRATVIGAKLWAGGRAKNSSCRGRKVCAETPMLHTRCFGMELLDASSAPVHS
ncbi:hypothetical protein E2562_008733 [Oryza meyeriana var. granulata]|uniref:Uncharacterized protein n=1 Tax=Oryza meyeriana var. granulata TaxID=110450 RepID=A0A6G1F5L4_9ORYZ|nr:hypothetical protein E2562_008733 [Oryza meyeriana var. granulata]